MFWVKWSLVILCGFFLIVSCSGRADSKNYVIGESKSYEASLYRQNCSICHGPEGEGKVLETGVVVPSLRQGQFKAISEEQIYNQIANGGNGMLAFRRQLSDREIKLLAAMVKRDLRGQ